MKPITQGQPLRKLFESLFLLGFTSGVPLVSMAGREESAGAPAKRPAKRPAQRSAAIAPALRISGGLFAFLAVIVPLAAEQLSSASSQPRADGRTQTLVGDSATGQKIFEKCRDCHSVQAGKYKTFGPNLYQIVGRQAGTAARHVYSPALANAGFVWSAQRLDSWLRDPKGFLPGSKMDLVMESAQARADVIAYLIAAGKR